MESRKPNCACAVCGKPVYRRPHELAKWKVYCSGVCMRAARAAPGVVCQTCKKPFRPGRRRRKFCSRSCANVGRRGITYSGASWGNASQRRLAELQNTFGFKHCMIEGCRYSRTYDIHRLEPGGRYVIGNMFAICPNHHAEIHRGLLAVVKVHNSKLRKA